MQPVMTKLSNRQSFVFSVIKIIGSDRSSSNMASDYPAAVQSCNFPSAIEVSLEDMGNLAHHINTAKQELCA